MKRLVWLGSLIGVVGVAFVPFVYKHQQTQALPTSQIEALLGNCEYFASIFPDQHDPINCVLETYRNVQAIRTGAHEHDLVALAREVQSILESSGE